MIDWNDEESRQAKVVAEMRRVYMADFEQKLKDAHMLGMTWKRDGSNKTMQVWIAPPFVKRANWCPWHQL